MRVVRGWGAEIPRGQGGSGTGGGRAQRMTAGPGRGDTDRGDVESESRSLSLSSQMSRQGARVLDKPTAGAGASRSFVSGTLSHSQTERCLIRI